MLQTYFDAYSIKCDYTNPRTKGECDNISPIKESVEQCVLDAAKLGWRASMTNKWYCPKHAL